MILYINPKTLISPAPLISVLITPVINIGRMAC